MKIVKKAHDRFFKQSLTDLAVAKDFLTTHLPKEVLAKFDLDQMELCKESYIDENLQEQLTDIIYKASIKSNDFDYKGYIYLLIEHQSKPISMMPLRIARYQLAIMNDHLLQNPNDKLPVVFPLLFYAGQNSPYPYSLNFFDSFHEPDLMANYFAKQINIIDLSVIPDEVIKQHKIISLLEYAQKHIYDRDLLQLVDTIHQLINQVCSNLGKVDQHLLYINSFFKYIIMKGNISNVNEFINKLETIDIVWEHNIMGTLAQHFEKQGLAKGIEQGITKGVVEGLEKGLKKGMAEGLEKGITKGLEKGSLLAIEKVARNMLNKKLSLKIISEITGLSSEKILKLKSASNKKSPKSTKKH